MGTESRHIHPPPRSRAVITGAMSAALAASALMLATPGISLAAQTVPQNPGQYCGLFGSGTTNQTVWIKQPPGCLDLNVTATTAPAGWDDYAGRYQTPNGVWHIGAKGYLFLANGKHNPNTNPNAVLLTNVATGTPMMILSEFESSDSVWINY
jgi:hypothetical protein